MDFIIIIQILALSDLNVGNLLLKQH